jgi:hypothetical protein
MHQRRSGHSVSLHQLRARQSKKDAGWNPHESRRHQRRGETVDVRPFWHPIRSGLAVVLGSTSVSKRCGWLCLPRLATDRKGQRACPSGPGRITKQGTGRRRLTTAGKSASCVFSPFPVLLSLCPWLPPLLVAAGGFLKRRPVGLPHSRSAAQQRGPSGRGQGTQRGQGGGAVCGWCRSRSLCLPCFPLLEGCPLLRFEGPTGGQHRCRGREREEPPACPQQRSRSLRSHLERRVPAPPSIGAAAAGPCLLYSAAHPQLPAFATVSGNEQEEEEETSHGSTCSDLLASRSGASYGQCASRALLSLSLSGRGRRGGASGRCVLLAYFHHHFAATSPSAIVRSLPCT